MKTSHATYLPASALPQSSLLTRPSEFVHESYQAQSREVSISLTTQEGDQITIRQSAMTEQLNAHYQKDENLRAIDARLATAGMSLAVQGDLNDQELADLSKLLSDLSAIAGDFFNGNLDKAMTGAMNINDMGSISTLEATFSRTTLLANYLEVPHPLPSISGLQPDPLLGEAMFRGPNAKSPAMVDTLTAQWQQFLDELTEQEALPDRRQTAPIAISTADAGRQMFERSQETMNAHPRLTPLIPSVAELALERARHLFEPGPESRQLHQEIGSHFTKEFNSWLL